MSELAGRLDTEPIEGYKTVFEELDTEPYEGQVFLSKIFLDDYSLFRCNRQQNINTVCYIEKLASSLELDLTSIDLTKVFNIDKNGNFIDFINKSLAPINATLIKLVKDKEFFESALVKVEDEVPANDNYILDQSNFISVLKDILHDSKDRVRSRLRERINRLEEMISSRQVEIRNMQNSLARINNLEKNDFNMECFDLNSLTNKYFKLDFADLSSDSIVLSFSSRDDVILKCQYENLRVNMGKYTIEVKFCIDLDPVFKIKVKGYEKNLYSSNGDYIHPHVSCTGDVCFGNLLEMFTSAQDKHDLSNQLALTHTILTNYNRDDAYCDLLRFAESSNQVQPDGHIREPESYDRDEYIECDNCGEEVNIWVQDGYGEEHCGNCDTLNIYEE